MLLLIFALAFPLAAENWWDNQPIEEIQFEGLIHVTPNIAYNTIAPYIGEEFTDELFTQMQQDLYTIENFAYFSARIEPTTMAETGSRIIFTVEELPIVDRIDVVGNEYFTSRNIRNDMNQKEGKLFLRSNLMLDQTTLLNNYIDKGFVSAQVQVSVLESNKEAKTTTLLVTVDEGMRTKIKDIIFEGNTKVSDRTLQRQLISDERSLFSRGDFVVENLELDKEAVRLYYMDLGHLDAVVTNITTDFVEVDGINELTITYYVEEGPQWFFDGITFEGNTIFADEELVYPIKFEIGDSLNYTKMENYLANMSDIYYDEGYIYNEITPTPTRNNDQNTVSYVVDIVERPKAIVGDIVVRGNEKTRDYVILREVDLKIGEDFSKKKLVSSLSNIYNTGLVSNVYSELGQTTDGTGTVVVYLFVEEKQTLVITGALGVSGGARNFPLQVQASFAETNLAGRGQSLSTSLSISDAAQTLSLSFTENWLFQRRLGYNSSISVTHALVDNIYQDRTGTIFTKDEYEDGTAAPDPYNSWEEYQAALSGGIGVSPDYLMEYTSWEISLQNSLGYTWFTDYGRFSLVGGLNNTIRHISYDDTLYRPYVPSVRDNLNRWRFKHVVWSRVAWDTRDYVYNPVKGAYIAHTFSYAGGILRGISHYLKSQSVGQAYIPLLSIQKDYDRDSYFHLVLVLKTNFTIMLNQAYKSNGSWEKGIVATPDEKLIIDGMNMARGWQPFGDLEVVWDNSIELTAPLAEKIIWADIFFSATGFKSRRVDVRSLALEDFIFSFGGGVRLVIPNFPFGFYFSKGFSYPNGEFQWKRGALFHNQNKPNSGIDFTLTISMNT